MAVVPSPPIFSPGISDTSSLNQLSESIRFCLDTPAFRGRATAVQLLTSAVWASILLDLEDLDAKPGGSFEQHSTSSNTSRFTAEYDGWYCGLGGIGFNNMATPAGRRGTRWSVNGSAVNGSAVLLQPSNSSAGALPLAGVFAYLSSGDYLEAQGFFEGGGTMNTEVAAERQPNVNVFFLRRAA